MASGVPTFTTGVSIMTEAFKQTVRVSRTLCDSLDSHMCRDCRSDTESRYSVRGSFMPCCDVLLTTKCSSRLTHGPPAGILDSVVDGTAVGCESLKARMPVLRPRLHVFGHIHEAHGAAVRNWNSTPSGNSSAVNMSTNQTIHINAANWPMGRRSRMSGGHVAFGTGPFQPVIVDLLNTA